MTEEELKQTKLIFTSNDKIYAPCEASLPLIMERMKNPVLYNAIQICKDKEKFRQLLSSIYPDFFFTSCLIQDLCDFQVKKGRKYIIKPIKGFFCTAIRKIDENTDLEKLMIEIKKELEIKGKYFSKDILSGEKLLIEEYIEGEEYAVDLYYSKNGKPIITHIMHHPINLESPYLQLLYYSDSDVFSKLYDKVLEFFTKFGALIPLQSFPLHAEFKLCNGNLIPIEINPLRFGGFGLADLPYFAFGLNTFESFFFDIEIDWKYIWNQKKNKEMCFSWVLGNNGIDLDLSKVEPDHLAFKALFSNILKYKELDYQKNPAFAIAYIKEKNKEKLFSLLDIEFCTLFK